jgi:DNA-binding GntR family transcriptional regulator
VLGVSPPTARQAVNRLAAAGVLEELPGSRWRRVYVARQILAILES